MAKTTSKTTQEVQESVDIGSGQVLLDNLLTALENIKEQVNVEEQILQELQNKLESPEFVALLETAVQDKVKETSERLLRRNSMKNYLVEKITEHLTEDQRFIDNVAASIVRIQERKERELQERPHTESHSVYEYDRNMKWVAVGTRPITSSSFEEYQRQTAYLRES